MLETIRPDWPYSAEVEALTTLRAGGVSMPPYHSLNLAQHVADRDEDVRENRRRLLAAIGERPVQWLRQVHGTRVLTVDPGSVADVPEADAAWTDRRGIAIAVLTADCLPIVLVCPGGRALAVVHAGWRGLVAGVLEAACTALPVLPEAGWIGPGIGVERYEVGAEVITAVRELGDHADGVLRPVAGSGKALLDLSELAARELARLGCGSVYRDPHCTAATAELFSYRRDGVTGRMATLAWLR